MADVDAVKLSRRDASEKDLKYPEHDTQIDASSILGGKDYSPYNVVAERAYPSMTFGPWVITNPEDRARDQELGFTHPYLHRRLDPKIPDDEEEVVPRDYQISIMGVHSYRTTTQHTHVDYQFLSDFKTKHPQYADEIDRRSELDERREIP